MTTGSDKTNLGGKGTIPFHDSFHERVYMILGVTFITAFIFSNIVSVTKFISFNLFGLFDEPLPVPIGVITYPLTFLITDLLSEFYGKHRTNRIVTYAIFMNLLLLAFMAIGELLPAHYFTEPAFMEEVCVSSELFRDFSVKFPEAFKILQEHTTTQLGAEKPACFNVLEIMTLKKQLGLPIFEEIRSHCKEINSVFSGIFSSSPVLIFGSILAFIFAQYTDVFLYDFWKNLTKGKHLWLRNNGSTLISQIVDTSIMVSAVFLTPIISDEQKTISGWIALFFASYAFKFVFALGDTVIFYVTVGYLRKIFAKQK